MVVLLHGLSKNKNSLRCLAKFLNKNGYSVLNISYPSTSFVIEDSDEIIHNIINREARGYKKVSFVAFSLGGLVTRAYLHKYKVDNLYKVIMIGTPNHVSEVANFLKNNRLTA